MDLLDHIQVIGAGGGRQPLLNTGLMGRSNCRIQPSAAVVLLLLLGDQGSGGLDKGLAGAGAAGAGVQLHRFLRTIAGVGEGKD